MNLENKRVAVIGLGASGIAAARLCAARGANVLALDSKTELSADARALEKVGVELRLGSHDHVDLSKVDLVVVSPGVPSFPALEKAEKSGVETIGEVELASRCLDFPAPIIAVGGTNGKSTTTTLIGELLMAFGKKVFVGGNLGEPLSNHTREKWDVIVLEVSSFQLERVRDFHPRVAALLNVTDDHLDRYPSFDAYADAKGNAFLRQTSADIAVVPFGDSVCLKQARRGHGRVVTFGSEGDVEIQANVLVDKLAKRSFFRDRIAIAGGHNALNVAAAIACVEPFFVPTETIANVLARFKGLDHRMSLVAEKNGVRFYDDSKGTNVGAAVTAVLGVNEPRVVLIAGGRDKGGSYEPLVQAMRTKGRAIVTMGEAGDVIANAFREVIPIRRANSMNDAVTFASEMAHSGDAVLLSPACSSFDMFRDYKHRGDEFAHAVLRLKGGE